MNSTINGPLDASSDLKTALQFQSLEQAREELILAFDGTPWIQALAYCDTGKLLSDIQHGRVTRGTALHAVDVARRTGRFPRSHMDILEAAILA